MKQLSHQLQTPFLQPDLLTLSSFITYCRDNNVLTDKEELEYYDQERLLVPAVRVLRGIVKFRKIYAEFNGQMEWRYVSPDDLDKFQYKKLDPKTYYDQGAIIKSVPGLRGKVKGFHYGNDGWLDWYLERDMVVYPATEGYKSWKTFSGGPSFSADPKPFENVSELMYAKHQIYPLKYIKNRRTMSIKNKGLFRTPESWLEAGNTITKIYSEWESNERLQNEVAEFNKFFAFWIDVRKLLLDKNKKVQEVYDSFLKREDSSSHEALEEAKEEAEFYDLEIKPKAAAIMSNHSFDLSAIQNWRVRMLDHGSFGTGTRSRALRAYLARLEDRLLGDTEDAYMIVDQLGWFLKVITGSGSTAKQMILRSMNDFCEYCGRQFVPGRKNQVTCGSPECKAKQQNEHKRKMRQAGKYKY